MADTAPATPFSARTNTPGPSGGGSTPRSANSGGRHLKRLSLSTASAFSPASPASPLSSAAGPSPVQARTGSATPTTPADRRGANHGVRGLRLSLSGSLPPSFGASPSPAASSTPATPLEERDLARGASTSPTLLRRSTFSRAPSSAPGTPPLGGSAPAGPSGSSSLRRSHSRRTSSISYARTSLDGAPNGLGLGGMSEEGGPRRSLDGLGLEGGLTPGRVSLDGAREEPEREDGEAGSSALARSVSAGSSAAGSAAAASQPTLVEQHADLLSFIAKKERKCLDLREELKRHESELGALKKKWEAIVARSLQQQASASSSSSHPRNNLSISTVSSASPNTSPTPRHSAVLHPAQAAHSLDLSLLSSTFDPTDFGDGSGGETPPIELPDLEIPESVKAAGTWLGSQLGRVLDAAVGYPSPVEERPNVLEALKEEDENEEDAEDDEESRSRRRESKGSSVETDASSVAGTRSTAPSSIASEETVSPLAPSSSTFEPVNVPAGPKPYQPRVKPTPPRAASSGAAHKPFTPPSSSSASSHPPPSSSSSPSSTGPSGAGHARSRSTLDALTGSWSSFNRRLSALSESETFQNSKRATMGLVDTFEQGLAQALGPLEPPRLEPLPPPSPTRRSAPTRRESLPSTAAEHPAAKGGEIPSPFLAADFAHHPASALSSPSPPAGRRESLPPSTAAAAGAGAMVPGAALSSVFSSWARSSAPASSSSSAPPPHQQQTQGGGGGGQAGEKAWDWSAFLPAWSAPSSSAENSPVKERRRSSVVREVKGAALTGGGKEQEGKASAPEDEGDGWPAW
ncbi:hypothetical protein JCM8097_008890 [Rhodosporidiobolus ruineniae]